eukprot:751335-Hanusia_phi.AAC.3
MLLSSTRDDIVHSPADRDRANCKRIKSQVVGQSKTAAPRIDQRIPRLVVAEDFSSVAPTNGNQLPVDNITDELNACLL